MLPEIYAEFSISGDDMLPDEITQLLGILPTKSWLKGEVVRGDIKRKESAWCITTPSERAIDVADHVEILMQIIEAKIPMIREISCQKGLYVLIDVAVYMEDITPAVCLNSNLISKLAQLGANFEVDIIEVGSDD